MRKTIILALGIILMAGCVKHTQQDYENDLKEIDRLQRDRFKYEAEQQKAKDQLEIREAINRAKARQ